MNFKKKLEIIDRKETRNISTNTYSVNEKYSYEGDILL
jgi:hypothetical protein